MRRLTDLTMPLKAGMRGVAFETAKALDRDGWNARTLMLYSHAGTHMDAPRHFIEGGDTIDRTPLDRCVGPARVFDLTGIAPREMITRGHLGEGAEKIGRGDRVLLHTGWSDNPERADYRTQFPRVGLPLAEWLVERGVVLLGVDAPSVADVGNIEELTAVHRTLLDGGVTIIEDLVNLGALRADVVTLVALPLKVFEGDGAPARVIAIEEGDERDG